jgi:DNA-binding MarR family transcriptional regulator
MRKIVNMSMYEFCLLLSRSDRAIRVLTARQLDAFDLTMMEWLLLATVDTAPGKGIAMSGVAQALDVTLPQITALANALVKKKLVKQRVNSKDRRSRKLTISRAGKKTVQDVDNAVNEAMRQWLGDIPEDQLRTFIKTVQLIAVDKAAQL